MNLACGVSSRSNARRRTARRRGVALITVLAIVVLLTALVVGFLSRVGTDRQSAQNYTANANAQLLADTAINLVQAAINQATTEGEGTTWASQPGVIRTFNDAGSLQRIYRLYSAPSLVTSTDDASVLADDLPAPGWAQNRAMWVDLNAPAVARQGGQQRLVFPILDPRDPSSPGTIEQPSVMTGLEGFSISTPPGDPGDRQPAPMPVRWLYVLQNGDIVPPQPGPDSTTVNVPGATKDNPIVGRVAFWTDDETAKININTASGSFAQWNGQEIPGTWDTPRFQIWLERMLFSENQP